MPAAVIFAKMASVFDSSDEPLSIVPLGENVRSWKGDLPQGHLGLESAMRHLTVTDSTITRRGDAPASQYEPRFFNGATLFPRLLIMVDADPTADPLGFGVGVKAIRSSRSGQEHEPWKSLPNLSGSVEEQFLHNVSRESSKRRPCANHGLP